MQPKNLFIKAALFLKFFLLIPGMPWIIKKHLKHCSGVGFIPGFRYLYGNIYAKNCFLCDALFLDYDKITIGENTTFGYGNIVITSRHGRKNRKKIYTAPVNIGKNVIVYTRCTILGGVTIGDNSIIGAGSVVTKDIPADCFAAGNPAKVIKNLDSRDRD